MLKNAAGRRDVSISSIPCVEFHQLMMQVHNVGDLGRVMELGSKNRSVGATLMNVDSSRSHSIFTIDIEMVGEGASGLRVGRLNLVDLAGSERQSKTGSTGDRLKEATKINLSLSALGNVISGEIDGRTPHTLLRGTKSHSTPVYGYNGPSNILVWCLPSNMFYGSVH